MCQTLRLAGVLSAAALAATPPIFAQPSHPSIGRAAVWVNPAYAAYLAVTNTAGGCAGLRIQITQSTARALVFEAGAARGNGEPGASFRRSFGLVHASAGLSFETGGTVGLFAQPKLVYVRAREGALAYGLLREEAVDHHQVSVMIDAGLQARKGAFFAAVGAGLGLGFATNVASIYGPFMLPLFNVSGHVPKHGLVVDLNLTLVRLGIVIP